MTCDSNTELCKNGGTCTNQVLSDDGLIGFSCQCQYGYTGKVCETKCKQIFFIKRKLNCFF